MENNIIQEYCLKNNISRDQMWFRFPHLRQELDFLENHIRNSHQVYPLRDQEYIKLTLLKKKN